MQVTRTNSLLATFIFISIGCAKPEKMSAQIAIVRPSISDHCLQLIGPSAKALEISDTHFRCELRLPDKDAKLSKIHLEYARKILEAEKSNVGQTEISKIKKHMSSDLIEYISERCPKNLNPIIDFSFREIICSSNSILKSSILINKSR